MGDLAIDWVCWWMLCLPNCRMLIGKQTWARRLGGPLVLYGPALNISSSEYLAVVRHC